MSIRSPRLVPFAPRTITTPTVLIMAAVVIAASLAATPANAIDNQQVAPPTEMAQVIPVALDTIVSYHMSQNNTGSYHDGYADFYSYAWGYHALRWKALSQSVSYAASWAFPPTGSIWQSDDITLNDNEADSCVFTQGNPPGGWGSVWAWNFKELAVGAAMFMDRWGSPVYTNLTIGGFSVPVVIRSITFNVDNPFGPDNMSSLCDFWGWNDQEVDVEYTAQSCAFHEDAYYSVSNMVISYWDPYLVDSMTISGETNLDNAFPFGDTFIGDPEDGAIVFRVSEVNAAATPRCAVIEEEVHPAVD